MHKMMISIGESARAAARVIGLATSEVKNKALSAMAEAIYFNQSAIQNANKQDIEQAKKNGLSASFLDRLTLTIARIKNMAEGLEIIAALPDPVGTIIETIKRPNGLEIVRIRTPIGVIGIIYEARPNVTADAAGICLKSGNVVILRGGSESFHSSKAIM